MARRPRSLVPLPLFLAGLLIAFQTAPVPTQTTAPSPTLYGVQGFGPAGAQSGVSDISELGSPIVGSVRSGSGSERAAV